MIPSSKSKREDPLPSSDTISLTFTSSDVLSELNHIRPLFTSYLRIRSLSLTSAPSSTPTKPSPELVSARKELQTSLSQLSEDLADLVESVRAIQQDPYKYGLEIEEVSRRQRLIDEVGNEVEGMREELERSASAAVPNVQGQGKGKGLERDDREGEGQDDYAAFEQQQQLHMLAEQDETLTSVFHTVGNLRQQADDMGRELEEQAGMLEETDRLADRVGGRLETGMKKMREVVRRNEDGLSSCCIAVLIFVLILLLILVLVL